MRRNNMPCGILDVFDLDPHLIQDSLGPPDLASQTAPRSIQPFLHSSRHTVPIIYNERPFPQNCPFAWGDLNSHLIHDSLFPCKHTTQTASQSVQPFLHKIPQSVPILYNGPPVPPPLKIVPSQDMWTPSNTRLLGPTYSSQSQNGISIVSVVFAGLTTVTDRQTDRQTTLLGL